MTEVEYSAIAPGAVVRYKARKFLDRTGTLRRDTKSRPVLIVNRRNVDGCLIGVPLYSSFKYSWFGLPRSTIGRVEGAIPTHNGKELSPLDDRIQVAVDQHLVIKPTGVQRVIVFSIERTDFEIVRELYRNWLNGEYEGCPPCPPSNL